MKDWWIWFITLCISNIEVFDSANWLRKAKSKTIQMGSSVFLVQSVDSPGQLLRWFVVSEMYDDNQGISAIQFASTSNNDRIQDNSTVNNGLELSKECHICNIPYMVSIAIFRYIVWCNILSISQQDCTNFYFYFANSLVNK